MRRKSERTAGKKTKSSPEKKAEKPKKSRSRRSRKQSASSDNESAEETVAEVKPVEVERTVPKTPVKEDSPEEAQEQVWHVKPTETSEEQGEIKKLKICLARPPSTPERPERSPRSKRKHSRATSSSDTPSNEGEERKKKHRSKRSMRESKESDKTQDSQEEIESQDTSVVSKPVTDETPMSTTDDEVKVDSQSVPDSEPASKNPNEPKSLKDTSTTAKEESESEANTSTEQDTPVMKSSVAVDETKSSEEKKDVSKTTEEKGDTKDSKEEETSETTEVSKTEEDNASNKAESSQNESNDGSNKNNVLEDSKQNESVVTRKMSVDSSKGKDIEDCNEDNNKKFESNKSTQSNQEEPITNGQPAPIVISRKRRWGSRPSKSTSQKSITISTDILKDIIPDVKPVEFEEVIEEKKHKRVEVTETLERPVLPKIVIDNTEQVEQNKKEDRDKENIRTREPLSNNRKISIVKENDKRVPRPPSPPLHSQSCILYITNLVRPFTLAQLKNLLQRTGRIVENGFWMDKIKSKCFVKYEDVEQAIETRHALHGVTWPVSNPKTLQVDFSDQVAFDRAVSNEETENTKTSSIPGTVEDWLREQDMKKERGELDKPWERKAAMREWDMGKNDKDEKDKPRRDDRTLDKRRQRSHERSPEPARKFKKKEEEAPAKLLDDLFKKTKTTPCIYWLPLSDEMIAIKEEQRRKHMAEHERRMLELRRNRRH